MKTPKPPERTPVELYAASIGLVRQRLQLLGGLPTESSPLTDAETVALQVRKIIEGIAFAALSGTEHRNKEALIGLRSKDGAEIIRTLARRKMLHLPCSQDFKSSSDPAYRVIMSGRGDRDITADELIEAFGLASRVIHERHPERLSPLKLEQEREALRAFAGRLRDWLWTHSTLHNGEAIIVQMVLYPAASWCVSASKIAPLPGHI